MTLTRATKHKGNSMNFICLCTCLFAFSSLNCGVLTEATTTNYTIDKNEMGLEVLFDLANSFLDDVVHTERISDSFLNLSTIIQHGRINEKQLDDWEGWADYLMGFSVCVAIGLLFIIIMLITGFVFCCCRTCGKCGAQKKIYESKRGKCKRRSYCTLLVILNTVTLVGVICAFMSNSLLYKHLENENEEGTIGYMKEALISLDVYVNTTVQEATNFIYFEFDVISEAVLHKVNNSAGNAVDNVLAAINATRYIDEAKDISREANDTKDVLEKVEDLLGNLQRQGTELQNRLTQIKSDVESACASPEGQCPGFNADDYNTEADFSSLGLLKNETEKVSDALDMSRYIADVEDKIEAEKAKAQSDIETQVNDASASIESVNKYVTDGIRDLRQKKDEALSMIPDAYKSLDNVNENVRQYTDYIYYAGLGVGAAYLLIIGLYYTGIRFGLCGEKPGVGAPRCNTGVGANFLLGGVAFTFIFSWILMLLCIVLFAVGGPAYTEVCRYFVSHDPSDIEVFDVTLRDGFDFFQNFSKNYSVSDSIRQCQENKALYRALELDSYVNLDEILNTQSVVDSLDELKKTNIDIDDITIISQELENKLKDFAAADIGGINFTDYFAQLQRELTKEDLHDLANATRVYAGLSTGAARAKLIASADALDQLHDAKIVPMEQKASELEQTLLQLQAKSNISRHINQLIVDLKMAQTSFNSGKGQLIKDEISKLADDIVGYVNGKLDDLKTQIRTNKFPCRALSTAIYMFTDSVCILGLEPVNGMWFSYGWCLFFFIPSLIFAVLLASQYRREHEYDKEYDDPNYMYSGHNNDTIPLTRQTNW